MADVTTLISNVGFPIVAFLICAYALKYSYDKSLEQMNETMDRITTLAEAINNNTIVLTSIAEKIERNEKEEAKNESNKNTSKSK